MDEVQLSPRLIYSYDGNKLVKEAFDQKYTDFFITIIGRIEQILPEDIQGIPHQRFLLRIPGSEQTILVAHNLQNGPRLHLGIGDVLMVSGEYVWNQHGGLMHLTHRNPNGNFEEGWVKVVKEIHKNTRPTQSKHTDETRV